MKVIEGGDTRSLACSSYGIGFKLSNPTTRRETVAVYNLESYAAWGAIR